MIHLALSEMPTPFFLHPLQSRAEQTLTHGWFGLREENNITPTQARIRTILTLTVLCLTL
jgi:hypothetical protein